MAVSTLFLTGFEHGFVGAGANAGTGLFDSVTGTGFSASISSPRNGAYCAHCVAPANTFTKISKNVSGDKAVVRFGVKVSARPASAFATIAHGINSNPGTTYDLRISPAGVLTMANAVAGTSQAGPTIDTTSWHLIEIQVDHAAGTIDWKVDGVAQTRVTGSAMGIFISHNLGNPGATQPAFTADYDDWICGTWTVAATDWYGDGKIVGQLAGVDGAHNVVTSFSFGDAGAALSGTVTTAEGMVDDPPGTGGWTATRSATDNLALRVATVAAYLEINPTPNTVEWGTPNAVRAIMSYSSSATQANLAACDVRTNGGIVTELWGLTGGVGKAYNIVANQFKGAIVTAPASGWSAGEVNALRFRFGGCTSVDISPVPTVQAMMLEVDWPIAPVASSSPDETVIDDFNRADGPINSGVGADIWETAGRLDATVGTTTLVTASNLLAAPTLSNYRARSKSKLQSDFDLLVDVVVQQQFFIWYGLTDLDTNVYDGYRVEVSAGTWRLAFVTNAASATLVQTTIGPLPAVGSTIWVAKRGTTTTVYYRPTVGDRFYQVLTITDSRNNISSPFILELPNTTVRLDNVRGGPLVTGATYNDSGSGNIAESGSSTEDYSHDASVSGTITVSGSGIESYSIPADYTDSASGIIDVFGFSSGPAFGTTDEYFYTDVVSGTITSSGNSVESYIDNDSRSGTVTASGIGTESYSSADSGSGTVTASGSGVDSYQGTYTDISSGTVIASGTGTESYSYADSGSGTVTISGTGIESYSYADSRSGTVSASGTGTESYSSVDSSSGTITTNGSSVEQTIYVDISSGTVIASGIGTESYSYADSGSSTVTTSGTGTESYSYTDSRSGTVTASGSGVESYQITYVDSGSGTVTASGSGTENYQVVYVDSGSGTITASGSGIESYQVASNYADSGSGTVTASGSGVESYQGTYADIASGTITSSGIATESYSKTDSGLGTIVSSGTGTESYSYADSGSGTVNASGTGSDTRVYPDASTGTITATGTGSDDRAYTDTNTGTIAATGTSIDAEVYTDTTTGTITATGTGVDAVVYVATGTGTAVASGTSTESSLHTISVTGTATANGTSAETASHSASAVGTFIATGTGIDSQVYGDALSGTALTSGTGVESYYILFGYADAASGQINVNGTSVESQSRSSTTVGSALAVGTSVESQSRSSTATGSALANGTRVESQSRSSTATGFVFVDGTGSESYNVDTIYTDTSVGSITSTGTGVDSVSYSNAATGTVTSTGTGIDTVFYSNTAVGTITLLGSGAESYSYEDAATGVIVLTGIGRERGTYTQPVPFSTVIALNRFNIAVWNKTPIRSVVTSTKPLSVQIALQRTIKVDVTKRSGAKVLVRLK